MQKLTLKIILQALEPILISEQGQVLDPKQTFPRICTDTRSIQPGDWFLALVGLNHDGHDYLELAIAAGAGGAIVSKLDAAQQAKPCLLVSDTLKAYQLIAQAYRRQLKAKVIAVTGSNGKTTVKELLRDTLKAAGKSIHCTQANENNEIGLPKSILACPHDSDYLVLELGMRGLGQIDELTRIAEPDLVAITNIGFAHVGLLGSREKIAQAKAEILLAAPLNAKCFIPEEPLLQKWAEQSRAEGRTVSTFPKAKIEIDSGLESLSASFAGREFLAPLHSYALLENMPLLASILTAEKIDLNYLRKVLEITEPVVGRGAVSEISTGVLLADDSYNASPDSLLLAGKKLSCYRAAGYRSVFVLGEIAELGDWQASLLEETVASLSLLCDDVFCLGLSYTGFSAPNLTVFTDQESLLAELKDLILAEFSSVILCFKASRAAKLEVLISKLKSTLPQN